LGTISFNNNELGNIKMSFLTELADHLRSVFAKANHNHNDNYEPKNANIQTHISSTSNPHGTTKSQVGLGNVTDHAQVKKSPSSVNGNVPVWNGNTGDALGGGYAVEGTLVGANDKLATAEAIKAYVDGQTSGTGGGLVPGGTQNITTLKAINTNDSQVFPDKILINVEDVGLFRLDRESSATADDIQVVQPNVGVGRWLKMTSHINNHNNTDNKQGGATGEYYHITANQFGALPAGISSANKLVAEDNAKLAKLRSDGTFPVNDIHVTAAEWTAFDNALNA
jgi:hypothetical protein